MRWHPRPRVVAWNAYAYHFWRYWRCYPIWAAWRNWAYYRLTRENAALNIQALCHISLQHAYRTLRKGEGIFWFTQPNGDLWIQTDRNLRNRVYREAGCVKNSHYKVPLEVYRAPRRVIAAYMALGAMEGRLGYPTARAYTAKVLGIRRLATVTAYRNILRRADYISTRPRYRRVRPPDGSKPKHPATFSKVRQGRVVWYRRDADDVTLNLSNLRRREKPVPLRDTYLLLARGGKRRRLGKHLLRLSEKQSDLAADLMTLDPQHIPRGEDGLRPIATRAAKLLGYKAGILPAETRCYVDVGWKRWVGVPKGPGAAAVVSDLLRRESERVYAAGQKILCEVGPYPSEIEKTAQRLGYFYCPPGTKGWGDWFAVQMVKLTEGPEAAQQLMDYLGVKLYAKVI